MAHKLKIEIILRISAREELINSGRLIHAPRRKLRRRERRLVGAVWEMLRFQAQTATLCVRSILSAERTVEEVAGVKLNSWLVRGHHHLQPALRRLQPQNKVKFQNK